MTNIAAVIIENTIGPNSAWFWTALQAVGVVTSLALIYHQVRVGRLVAMREALLSIEHRFASPAMRKVRVAVSTSYLDVSKRASRALDVDSNRILILFEEMGLMMHLGIISRQMLWERVSHMAIHYWYILEPKISEIRTTDHDDTWYERFEQMVREMERIEKRRIGRKGKKAEADLSSFAKEEIVACS